MGCLNGYKVHAMTMLSYVKSNPDFRNNVLIALLSSLVITSSFFLLASRSEINLADEGYLWYGAQRTLLGEVPQRDFQAYDVARYYWVSFFMFLLGDNGLFSARLACAIFQYIEVSVGVLLALHGFRGTVCQKVLYSLLVSGLFDYWVVMYYKVYDQGMCFALILSVALLLTRRAAMGWFFSGFLLGLAAVFGRNHGLYGIVGFILAMGLLLGKKQDRPTKKLLFAYAFGVLCGYLPILLGFVFIDGFLQGFVSEVRLLFEIKSTNLTLPIQWPWMLDIQKFEVWQYITRMEFGIVLLLLVMFPVACLGFYAWRRHTTGPFRHPVFVASIVVALPYAHYVYSRADMPHLSFSIYPFLLALLLLPTINAASTRIFTAALLIILSRPVVGSPPGLEYLLEPEKYQITTIANTRFVSGPYTRLSLGIINKIVNECGQGGASFLAMPNMPTVHALYGSDMGIYDIYQVHNMNLERQKKTLADVMKKKPELIIIDNNPLDGREELRFKYLNPVVYEWIAANYQAIQLKFMYGYLEFYVSRDGRDDRCARLDTH